MLVYDCDARSAACWALFLQVKFSEEFDTPANVDYLPKTCFNDGGDKAGESESSDDKFVERKFTNRQLDLAASGRQAPRHRPQQLVPDGLTCEEHFKAGLEVSPVLGRHCFNSRGELGICRLSVAI